MSSLVLGACPRGFIGLFACWFFVWSVSAAIELSVSGHRRRLHLGNVGT